MLEELDEELELDELLDEELLKYCNGLLLELLLGIDELLLELLELDELELDEELMNELLMYFGEDELGED